MRYFVCAGDRTSAGGVVVEGSNSHVYAGRAASFHGARIECPACRSTGVLIGAGPRHDYSLPNGLQIAVEGDVCACRCRPRPVLVASQRFAGMEVGARAAAFGPVAGSGAAATDERGPGRRFLVTDSETGEPLRQRRFIARIGAADQEGVTDVNGLASIDAPAGEAIELHVFFSSPRRELKGAP